MIKKWMFATAVVLMFSACEEGASGNEAKVTKQEVVKKGEVLTTDYFDVTVNDLRITSKIESGNPYLDDVIASEGQCFLIINTTFKNTNTESRMIFEGSLEVKTPEGKSYMFDKTESILGVDGYGALLEQINPLTSFTTNIVFQMPKDIKGSIYYHPGRSDGETIDLGKIN